MSLRQRMLSLLRKAVGPGEAEKARMMLERKFPGVAFGVGVQVIGLDFVRIGDGSCIGDHSWINDCLRDRAARLEIGKYVLIGRGGVISTAGRLEIGDFTILAPGVFIADADHVFDDPFQPVLQQGVTAGRSVIVEENCWFGMQAKAFGDVTIGRGSVVAAGSIVRKSVPPFCVVAGAPARVVKMYDFDAGAWVRVRGAEEEADMLEKRRAAPPPDRAAYRETLHRNSRLHSLEPLLAGAYISI